MAFTILASVIVIAVAAGGAACAGPTKPQAGRIVSGEIRDALDRPIQGVEVSLQDDHGRVVSSTVTDSKGKFELTGVPAGLFVVVAKKRRFAVASKVVTIAAGAVVAPVTLAMKSLKPLTVAVSATQLSRAPNQLSASGNSAYTMNEKNISELPAGSNSSVSQVLLQMPGVAQDENGQVHIRGAHADLQWRINGIMLPLDSFSGFGQVLSSYSIRSFSLVDGALPAQYGYRDAGILDIQTKDGCSDPGGHFELYGGERDTARPSVEYGGCKGNFSFYTTGFYLHDNIGLSSATAGPNPLHDVTDQGQWFGYFSYFLDPTTRLTLTSGVSVADNQFPNYPGQVPLYKLAGVNPINYPSTNLDENLSQRYYFGIFALQGAVGTKLDYQIAYTAKYNTVTFSPDPIGDLIYQGVASTVFHSELANTLQGDITYRFNKSHTFAAGFYAGEYGETLDDTSRAFPANSSGKQTSDIPVSIVNNLNGIAWLAGIYGQDHWQLTEKVSLDYGLRWDQMAGFVGSANQLSPRANLVYKPRQNLTFHAGFSRYFQTPSFYTISPRSFSAFNHTTAEVLPGNATPLPESDWYFDVGGSIADLLPGLTVGEDAYFELAHNLLDLGQFGFVPIFAPFNYTNGRIYGAETTASYKLGKALSFGANFSYSVAQGTQVETGQFNFTPGELKYADSHYIYLDHQQFYTASSWAAYNWGPYLFSIDGNFGSGLRAGFANTGAVPYNWQINLGAGRSFDVTKVGKVTTRVVLINAFDRTNILREGTGIGIFTPAYGPRQALYGSVAVPLPSF
ncbi:MAG TPA: TonB-dependent receptor [Candidatus Binataceae bacterium]|nr:TonB-dependent receptor [Candidatus Binataceae bacterium]